MRGTIQCASLPPTDRHRRSRFYPDPQTSTLSALSSVIQIKIVKVAELATERLEAPRLPVQM